MHRKDSFTWVRQAKSFRYAFQGFAYLIRNEHNARIHCGISLLVITLGFIFQISSMEWVAIIACMGAVIAAEAFNTAIECLCNHISPDYAPFIKHSKDCAAAAVLALSLASLLIGIIIFLPYLWVALANSMP